MLGRLLALLALLLIVPGSTLAQPSASPLKELRNKLLTSKSSDLGIHTQSKNEIWGVLFEWGVDAGNSVTLLTLKDGTTSLYFSTGGGIIGAGQYANVRDASRELIDLISTSRTQLRTATVFPTATTDHVIFYALTDSKRLSSGSIDVAVIQKSKHLLYSAGNAAQALISEIRKATPPEGQEPSN